MQILSEKVVIRCEAYLVKEKGEEVHREALSKSQLKTSTLRLLIS